MTRRILSARDQVALLAPWRAAAVNGGLVDRLKAEFDDWAAGGNAELPPDTRIKHDENGDYLSKPYRINQGFLGYWPNIEKFFKEKYPAVYSGFDQGLEQAGDVLDSPYQRRGYPTGPEAVAQHGYDPKEIAAGMLLLHNQTHPGRKDLAQEDQQRLNDIAQKRFQMQRAYEKRQNP